MARGPAVRRATITDSDEQNFGYTEICAELAERFGTSFKLAITGNCATLVANFEGGIQLVITDCEATLSPIEQHLDGRAEGFYVGLHRPQTDAERGAEVELAYAYSEIAPPTAEAIGALVAEAVERALPGWVRRSQTR